MCFISMYSVLNTLSELNIISHIKKHFFIHVCCLFLILSKAVSVSLMTLMENWFWSYSVWLSSLLYEKPFLAWESVLLIITGKRGWSFLLVLSSKNLWISSVIYLWNFYIFENIWITYSWTHLKEIRLHWYLFMTW